MNDARKSLDRAAEVVERLLKPQEHGLTILGTYSPERLTVELFVSAGLDKIGWLGEITVEQAEQGFWPGQAQNIRDRYDNLVGFYGKSNNDNSQYETPAVTKKLYEDIYAKLKDDNMYKTYVMGDWGKQTSTFDHLINQTFGMAIWQLKHGRRAFRDGWNGKNMYIRLESEKPERDQLAFIELKTADGKYVPWLASQTDMLAEDWRII